MILSAKCFAVGTRGVLLFCINWHKCPVLHSDSSADQWQESQHRYLGLWGICLLKFVFHSCFQVPVVNRVGGDGDGDGGDDRGDDGGAGDGGGGSGGGGGDTHNECDTNNSDNGVEQ